ncbi:arabinosyltransferase domain-containing protein [Pseudonocardia aurantiaca]|uniref:Arabinosyltransferase domain-containing protein n=1 Tax=Pseudonocardia aurantiaca TaxID=75290 RepID=A0ABW4FCB6_9PSEU
MSTTDQVAVAAPPAIAPPPVPSRRRYSAAAALGVLATALAVAFPFMPVQQDTATVLWPGASGDTTAVNAPAVALRPLTFTADVGCAAIRSLDERSPEPALVLGTTPPGAPAGPTVGLSAVVADGMLTVADRGTRLTSALLPAGACDLAVLSTATATQVRVGGAIVADVEGDQRPQVVGVYSDLDGARDEMAGTAVRVEIDNRFDSSASALKTVVGTAAVLALLACLWAFRPADAAHGRRPVRIGRPSRRGIGRDAVVVATLAGWAVIGGITVDDGYILTMARAAESSGWIGNYYRWFDVPEAPFGWFYELYAAWAQVSDSVLWLRIPSLVMGVASWLVISRLLLPRLGPAVRRSATACWAAATLFVCFWLPFGSGLRPEPVVVFGALLTAYALERALATRRLLPLALGLVAAAFALAATPTGLLAPAVYLAGIRPLLRLLKERAALTGWIATLTPLLGAGAIVLVAVFGDQTWATVVEATRVRTAIGPALPWYAELYRYTLLFAPIPDGSLARRFPVLVMVVCAAVVAVVMLRRIRIPGVASGPAARTLATVGLGFVVLALTPTKWTHHFGAFAGLGAMVAALAAVATSDGVLRARRNRLLAGSAVLAATALAFTGPNSWWYVSNWGVPWFDQPPRLGGVTVASVALLGAAVLFALALAEHLRGGKGEPRQGRSRRTGAALAVLCGAVALFVVASTVKAVQQAGGYSVAAEVVTDPGGTGCGLSSRVLVETDPAAGVLSPAQGSAPALDGFGAGWLPPSGPGSPGDVDGDGGTDPAVAAPGPVGRPVLGSYRPGGGAGELTTEWFTLPAAAREGRAPLVVQVAGQVGDGTSVTVELGRSDGDGTTLVDRFGTDAGSTITAAADPSGTGAGGWGWRDVRFDLSGRPDADQVRVVAEDRTLAPAGWVAVAPPRMPHLTPLLDVVGSAPGYLDWPVAFPHPCLRSFPIHDGVAEMPAYRVLADPQQRGVGENWSAPPSGGPLAWLTVVARQRVVPTYLDGQWGRDWGQLRLVEPYAPAARPADLQTGRELVWGWNQAAQIGAPPPGNAAGWR